MTHADALQLRRDLIQVLKENAEMYAALVNLYAERIHLNWYFSPLEWEGACTRVNLEGIGEE